MATRATVAPTVTSAAVFKTSSSARSRTLYSWHHTDAEDPTMSIAAKLLNMRKAQSFTVYPLGEDGNITV